MSSATELKAITDALGDYFDQVNANLGATSNPLPSFEDFAEDLTFDSILTDAQQSADRSASYSVGALADMVYLTSAITREFGMRSNNKSQYYLDAQDESLFVIDYLEGLYGQYLNYFRGTSPEQDNSKE
jgi:hypothetical protein